ncbi:MAG TPA: hypothetical protein VL123_08310 [Candidatus Udaeobacter sp.]|jgi:hypothetical protein|nr:hypothetical protein [Candidatus Udaeobacter sp.]
MRRILAFVFAAALTTPVNAFALGERAWLQISGGGGNYAMGDINRDASAYNQANPGAAGFNLIKNGASFGGSVGFETPSHWNFGVSIDRMLADTKVSDASGAADYQFHAYAIRGFGEYSLRPIGSSSLRIGAGVGMVAENGDLVESTPGNAPQKFKIGGSGPLYEGYAGGDLWLGPTFAIVGTGGYRYARTNSVTIAGGTLITSNGEADKADYSGVFFRVGIKLAAPEN